MKNLNIFLAILCLALTSCSKNDDATTQIEPTPTPTDVYIAGSTANSSGKRVPTIWKNGVPSILPSDTNIDVTIGRIIVDGNNVYALNNEFNNENKIFFWKNSNLTEIASNGKPKKMVVDNNDVYILGVQNGVSKYWKNGIPTTLTGNVGYIIDMIVKNGVVHIIGTTTLNQKQIATLWVDNQPTILLNSTFSVIPTGFTINNNETNVFLKEFRTTGIFGGDVNLKLWKNGNVTTLISDTKQSDLPGQSVLISENNNVHILSHDDENSNGRKLLYWKNSIKTNITNGQNYADFKNMKIIGNDVYILGRERDATTSEFNIKIWKNNIPTTLNVLQADVFNDAQYDIDDKNNIHVINRKTYLKNNEAFVLQGNLPDALDIVTVN
jgi:hypothetical protein